MRSIMNIINESIIVEFDVSKTASNYRDKILAAAADDYGFPYAALSDPQTTLDVFFNQLKKIDPTPHQEYSRWLTVQYSNRRFDLLQSSEAHAALTRYHELKKADRLTPEQRDINRFKSVDDLVKIVDTYADRTSMRLPNGADLVLNSTSCKLISMETVEAVRHFAKISNRNDLCTNQADKAEEYLASGTMYVLFPRKPKYIDEMYQLHFSDGYCEATNGLNEPINIDQLIVRFPDLVGCQAFAQHNYFNIKQLVPSPSE